LKLNSKPNNSIYSFNPDLNPPLQGLMYAGFADEELIGTTFNFRANVAVMYS
jgi:hypothetical protein